MGPWMMGYGGIGWFIPIISVIVLGLIIWGVVVLIKSNTKTVSSSEYSAMDILKKRYARGEIDKTEYEEKKKDLV